VLISQRPPFPKSRSAKADSPVRHRAAEPGFGYTLGNSLRLRCPLLHPVRGRPSIRIDGVTA